MGDGRTIELSVLALRCRPRERGDVYNKGVVVVVVVVWPVPLSTIYLSVYLPLFYT